MTRLSSLQAVEQARAIIAMAAGPFVPAELAAALRPVSPDVAASIPAACTVDCADLADGTGRVVYVPRLSELHA